MPAHSKAYCSKKMSFCSSSTTNTGFEAFRSMVQEPHPSTVPRVVIEAVIGTLIRTSPDIWQPKIPCSLQFTLERSRKARTGPYTTLLALNIQSPSNQPQQ